MSLVFTRIHSHRQKDKIFREGFMATQEMAHPLRGDFGREMDLKRWKNGTAGIGVDRRGEGVKLNYVIL
jgi:hypothetical protein